MKMRRLLRPIGMIGLGLALGVALGLYLGWVVWPIEFTNADPTLLPEADKGDYALMIAGNFAQDGDLNAAKARLATLGLPDPKAWFLGLTVDAILEGTPATDVKQLVKLADALELYSPVMDPYLPEKDG